MIANHQCDKECSPKKSASATEQHLCWSDGEMSGLPGQAATATSTEKEETKVGGKGSCME